MPVLRRIQSLNVEAVREIYTVSERTMRIDQGRKCWLCGYAFRLGDGMTVAITDEGNKLMHSRCYADEQV